MRRVFHAVGLDPAAFPSAPFLFGIARSAGGLGSEVMRAVAAVGDASLAERSAWIAAASCSWTATATSILTLPAVTVTVTAAGLTPISLATELAIELVTAAG